MADDQRVSGPHASRVPDFAPPRDIPQLEPFWAAVDHNELALPFIPGTNTTQWYPLAGYPGEQGQPLEWRTVPGTGTIYTWSRVEWNFLPSGGEPPFTIVLVEPDEAPGVRIVSVLVGEGNEAPTIGSRVRFAPTIFEKHTLPTFELVNDVSAAASAAK